jgi:hypothetical protein
MGPRLGERRERRGATEPESMTGWSRRVDEVWRAVVSEYGPASSVPAIALERRSECVRVWCGDGWEASEHELRRAFGSAVRVSVGFRAASAGGPPDVPPPACQIPHRDLHLTCEASAPIVRRGDRGLARVSLENRGSSRVSTVASADVAFLCDPHSHLVLAVYRGARTGVALPVELDPGEQTSLNVVVGTGAVAGSGATFVQPGEYEIVCPIALIHALPAQGRSRRWLLARGATVQVA